MGQIIHWLTWIAANYAAIVSSIMAVFVSLIALFMLIPGEQPEKFLQGAVDFLKKFSAK